MAFYINIICSTGVTMHPNYENAIILKIIGSSDDFL